ncbi:MAG: extracellular solute-binding protein, partial [Caldilineae bacterium]
MSKKLLVLLAVLALLSLVAAQCAAATPETVTVVQTVEVVKEVPKEVVKTVEVEKKVVETVEVVQTVEVVKEVPLERTVVEFWTTDNEEERVKVYEEVAARYMAEHPDVEVRIVPIEEAGVSQRIATAVAANRKPDIVRMGIERVAAFAADGI